MTVAMRFAAEGRLASALDPLPRRPSSRKLASMAVQQHAPRPNRAVEPVVVFTRAELARILSVYGQFVAAGEWRDYGLDHLSDRAVFSVFRRAAETPVYRIEKHPRLADRQGAFMVVAMSGAILRRGKDLVQVLRVFDRSRLKLAGSE